MENWNMKELDQTRMTGPSAPLYSLKILVFLLCIIAPQIGVCGETPVLEWTAGRDPMNFRYSFLEDVKTTTLLKATPETGTWNHHQYVFYLKGVMFALFFRLAFAFHHI